MQIDFEQQRLVKPRILSVAAGFYEPESKSVKLEAGWDQIGSLDTAGDLLTWVDPVTGTLMLRPAPLSKNWDLVGTGIYTRLAKSNFTFADSSKWQENDSAGNGASKFLELKDSTAVAANRSAVSTATYAKNTGFYVGLYGHSWNNSNVLAFEGGWNSTASDSSGVSVKVYLDGTVDVYKDGDLIEKGNLRSQESKTEKAGQVANQVVSLLLIPFRKAELLVVSNLGGAFTAVFDDIDETEDDPAITAATNFWFNSDEASGKSTLEIAPIAYPTGGWRASAVSAKIDAPGAGLEPIHTILHHGDTVSASLVTATDATVAFVPDGELSSWRTKAVLTRTLTYRTPMVFSVISEFLEQADSTPSGDEKHLASKLIHLSLDVPESPSGVTVSCTVKAPDSIDGGDIGRFLTIGNRPAMLFLDMDADGERGESDLPIVEGAMSCPSYSLQHSDEITFCDFEIRDFWQRLENCMFTDEVPLDTLSVDEAVRFILQYAGIPENIWDIEEVGVDINGPSGSGSRGDYVAKVEIGDTCADWIQRLHESYCATWFYGFVPTSDGIKFRWISPEMLGNEPKITLFSSIEDVDAAILGGTLIEPDGADENWRNRLVFRTLDQDSIDPECNRIVVTGLDLRKRLPILRVYDDTDSQDVSLSPSSRPDNWLGELRQVGFRSPQLTTSELVDEATRTLAKRLTVRRYMVEIECELLFDPGSETEYVPLWRGDVVTLNGLGDYRILSLNCTVESDPDHSSEHYNSRSWRPTRYVLEKIVEGTAEGLGGNSMASSVEQFKATTMMGVFVRTRQTAPMEIERKRPAASAGRVT